VHLFQHKFIPEFILRFRHYRALRKLWQGFPQYNINAYLNLFSEKGALTGAVNWYRALLQLPQIDYTPVKVPTTFIWGNQDLAIARAGVMKNKDYLAAPYKFIELNAGHWFMEFNQAEICDLILQSLKLK
jgi:pimeloyl-ACP methyl ester carboxylesterase